MNWPNNAAGIKTVVILLSFAFLFIVAVLLDLQYLYLMSVTLAVLPLASYGLAQVMATRFDARREHPHTVSEGRAFPVTLTVAARGGIPQGAIRIADALPPLLTPDIPNGGSRPLDTWDGQIGSQTYHVTAEKRGVFSLGPASIYTTDPLGLFGFAVKACPPSEVVVHPQPILSRASHFGAEGRLGRRERDGKTHRGEGMDFHGVREYRTGDTLRRVHWPTTARTGKLAVVEFERAFQQDVVVCLDRARGGEIGAGRETTLEYAVKIAATLVDRALRAGGGVTLVTQGAVLTSGLNSRDRDADRYRFLDALARLTAESDDSLAVDLRGVPMANGAYIALITSRWDPAVSRCVTDCLRNGCEGRVYFVDPASFGGGAVASPAIPGTDLRLVAREDNPWLEGGRRLEYLLRP
jgi:uncharacterized protein (DUF58 family)